ncbi:MFS general substrate transporter [Aulographum hederae CBS 113979]|uniref:MFS general substrate transporter n=1 Tax=Aulographum hederae CBS 113979 TaxID=1176131 RepID=A0A6G1GVI8_9PEZI|nr:MFS general substrate transporter [Aulographum hederae CBS 113979]
MHVSNEVAGLVTTLFLLGYCMGPLVWAPLSEYYGRRWVFYITFSLYLSFNFLCAFTPNFAGLLTGRFLTGMFAASALSNAPGLVADMWSPVERGNAMILFIVATFAGPALGPVVAGFLELKKTWRWTFYVLLWLAGATEVLLLTIPETLPAAVLRKKARQTRRLNSEYSQLLASTEMDRRGLASLFNTAWTRPWGILVDPISFLVAIFYSVVYTLLYMLFDIYPIVFQQQRRWNVGIGELPLIGVVIGACIGGLILYLLSIKLRNKIESGHHVTPEDRLPAAMVGGVLFPITMFWFAWTAEFNSIHWIVPTIAGTFLATSILLIFVGFINYLVDVYTAYAASAMAANTILRSACAAAAPLFTQYMFDAVGVGGGGSLIGGVAVLLAPIPFIFSRYGEEMRRRSNFATTTTRTDGRVAPRDEKSHG